MSVKLVHLRSCHSDALRFRHHEMRRIYAGVIGGGRVVDYGWDRFTASSPSSTLAGSSIECSDQPDVP
ncbi:hypothetical protein Hypma_004101 [Hypsizygus marmoreus]|uniref:Uncharacterized protein n=1 Tax=Hypsizygus marmoreus TaxID=39966 RepID=A0A369K1J6_HYPMA|nr:hypothetical protein Hypma_004101 [Hypsizygus marmoreus]